VDGPLVALWSEHDGPPPAPSRAVLRGRLSGTVHGPLPEHAQQITRILRRIRVVSHVFVLNESREIRPPPGTFALADVQRSPRWFAMGDRPIAPGVERAMETGVLPDLAVPLR
jgi:hypothetical protein